MVSEPQPAPPRRGRALREVLVYGIACGALIALVKVAEARFLAVESSFGLYAGLLALLFAGVGLWLGAPHPGGQDRTREAAHPTCGREPCGSPEGVISGPDGENHPKV